MTVQSVTVQVEMGGTLPARGKAGGTSDLTQNHESSDACLEGCHKNKEMTHGPLNNWLSIQAQLSFLP